jgi:8-oxo-dGTP pyrophosphatase MutT (NUDIX family)
MPLEQLCDRRTAEQYRELIAQGGLLRAEDPQRHISAYFLPVDPESGRIHLVHHRKAQLWLAPGGHVEPGERLRDPVAREIAEELGVAIAADDVSPPFLATITEIDNPRQVCRRHYDLWHLVSLRECQVAGCSEFLDAQWMAWEAARAIVVDPANVLALDVLAQGAVTAFPAAGERAESRSRQIDGGVRRHRSEAPGA